MDDEKPHPSRLRGRGAESVLSTLFTLSEKNNEISYHKMIASLY